MSPTTDPDFDSLLTLANALADCSGAAILPYFRRENGIDNKAEGGDFDPVTAADRAAEQVIREKVEAEAPAHAILGEELGFRPGSGGESPYCWIIDPIDGTRAFIAGFPTWGTLIGLTRGDEPLLGIMNQPFTGERFWSGETASYYRWPGGERRMQTRVCRAIEDATMLCTAPEMFTDAYEIERFDALSERVRLRRFGGDCYSYCMLAAGHADLVVESGLQSYDIAALIPIVERAGGRVTTWDGEPAAEGGRIVASGDPDLHSAVLEILAG